LSRYAIVDINVDNPPMEQIIAQIYQVEGNQEHGAQDFSTD